MLGTDPFTKNNSILDLLLFGIIYTFPITNKSSQLTEEWTKLGLW